MTVSVSGVFLSSFCTNYSLFVMCYAVMFGLGGGFMYTAPLIVGWSHYPANRGRVTGIIMAAYGLTSMFFNIIATYLVNPDNLPPSIAVQSGLITNHYFGPEVADRTPYMIRCLAGMYLVLGALGVICMGNAVQSKEDSGADQVTIKQGFCSPVYWKLCAASYLSSSFSMYIAAAFKNFGSERLSDDYFLAYVGSVSALVNGLSRVAWAESMDRLGAQVTYIILLVAQIFTSATLYYFATTRTAFMFYICLCFLNQGGHFVIFPTICAKFFGKMTGAGLYAVLFNFFGLASVTGYIIQKLFLSEIGYEYMFLLLTAAGIGSLAIAFTIKEPVYEKSSLMEPLNAKSS
jgi:OFA family oxalate/formate antiporter-like MFS transporter